MRDSENKVVVITGGTGALGKAVTRAFLEAGTQVIVLYHTEAGQTDLLRSLKNRSERLLLLPADVTQEDKVRDSIQQAVDRFGRLDVLVHLVGGYIGDIPVAQLEETTWDHLMTLNLKSAFLCCKIALGHMLDQESGAIIMIGARAAVTFGSSSVPYAVAKAGVHALTQALAREVRGKNININAVIPGIIDTPANRQSMPHADFSTWAKPDQIAQVILFLSSDAAKEVTGGLIPVYGTGGHFAV